jgi:hypothetical protein
LVDAITDPDVLAEESCTIGLIHPESKRMLQSFPVDAKTKARCLLQSIEGKLKDQPIYFHLFLAVLKKLPGLANLGTTLQKTYGITLGHYNEIHRFSSPQHLLEDAGGRSLPRAHVQGVKQSVLSVCLSICLSVRHHKNRQI